MRVGAGRRTPRYAQRKKAHAGADRRDLAPGRPRAAPDGVQTPHACSAAPPGVAAATDPDLAAAPRRTAASPASAFSRRRRPNRTPNPRTSESAAAARARFRPTPLLLGAQSPRPPLRPRLVSMSRETFARQQTPPAPAPTRARSPPRQQCAGIPDTDRSGKPDTASRVRRAPGRAASAARRD